MVSLGHGALDGTKRMLRAEILDAQEDKRYGKGKLGSDLPDELRRPQDRMARIRQARKEMEAETAAATARQRQEQAELPRKTKTAAAKARGARAMAIEAAQDAGQEPPDLEPLAAEGMPWIALARKADGTPIRKTQRNFTDPDSYLMQLGGSYLQGYNCQAAVDAGYWSEDNAKAGVDQGIDAYIATGRLPHGQPPPPKRGPLPRDAEARTRMALKLRSKKGSAIYAQRKAIVEPANGT
jgi:hypothetical protein